MSTPQVPVEPPAGQPPRFAVDARVRVKAGTTDPDFDDIPLGGWAGVVREVESHEGKPIYLVAWSAETVAAAHPVYRRRCERDGMDIEEAWMGEEDLEPDLGGPVVLEQPTKLRPPPLNMELPEDRALALFGLTADDELPAIEPASLARFHERLRQRVRCPFAAHADWGPLMVVRLLPVDRATPEEGLFVEVADDDGDREEVPLRDVEWVEGTPGWRELEAYTAWLEQKHGVEDEEEWTDTDERPRRASSPADLLLGVGKVVVLACVFVGAALKVLPESALLAAQIGGAMFGALGAFVLSGLERMFRGMNRLPPGIFGGLLLGLGAGAVVGAAAGTLVLAWVGAIPGAILATIVVNVRTRYGHREPGVVKANVVGAYLGGLIWLFVQDWGSALAGGLLGLVAGIVLFVVGVVLATMYLGRMLGGPGPKA